MSAKGRALTLILAGDRRRIAEAQRVRWLVYGQEEGMLPLSACTGGRQIDAGDDLENTAHLLVCAGAEPVGTVRLIRGVPGGDAGDRLGLELGRRFDLRGFACPPIVAAEISRYCVLRRWRGTPVARMLVEGLRAESARRGITHWLAGANTETDCAEDAHLAYRVAQLRNLISERYRTEPRAVAPATSPRRRPCYSAEQRGSAAAGQLADLPLPPTLALFARRMGARYTGPPAYDETFGVFALPLVAEPAG